MASQETQTATKAQRMQAVGRFPVSWNCHALRQRPTLRDGHGIAGRYRRSPARRRVAPGPSGPPRPRPAELLNSVNVDTVQKLGRCRPAPEFTRVNSKPAPRRKAASPGPAGQRPLPEWAEPRASRGCGHLRALQPPSRGATEGSVDWLASQAIGRGPATPPRSGGGPGGPQKPPPPKQIPQATSHTLTFTLVLRQVQARPRRRQLTAPRPSS